MAHTLLDIFTLICVGLLGWGISKPERAYQFPFIMGFIFVSFLLPQAFVLVDSPGAVSPEALIKVLVVSCLCAACCLVGYQIAPHRKLLQTLNIRIDHDRLFNAAIVLAVMGHLFSFLIGRTVITTTDSGTWSGAGTIYIFFFQVIYIAFTIFLIEFIDNPNFKNFLFTAFSGFPIIQVVMVGRRQPTMTLTIIVGLAFFLTRRYVPPRWVFVSLVFATVFLIPVVGLMREKFWILLFSGDWDGVSFGIQQSFSKLVEGDTLELRNAALLIDATDRAGHFGFGKGYWNSLVFQYVPGQILGTGFKASLQFEQANLNLEELYNYSIPSGTTPTAIGEVYTEFSYFGCLVFTLMAYLFKHLWIGAVYLRSIPCQLLYVGLISPAMVGLTHATARFLQEFVFQAIVVGLVTFFCRYQAKQKPQEYLDPSVIDI
jgi:hypothetical protein